MNKFEYMNFIYGVKLGKKEKMVIMNLLNRADKNMTCFPSVKKIAEDCSMSERSVQRAVKSLVEDGFLKRESRFHDRGGQRSNYYTILKPEIKIEEVNFFEREKKIDEVVEIREKRTFIDRIKNKINVILS